MESLRQAKSASKRLRRVFYRNLSSPRARYRDAVECLDIPHEGRILDIGCGYNAPDLQRFHLPPVLRVGIDMVDGFVREGDRSVTFCGADANQLPFGNSVFHAVVCRSVMEHLEDPQTTFRESFRVLAPGRYFALLTPNRYDYVSLIASAIPNRWHGDIVRLTTGRDGKDTFPTRYRANTIGALKKLATSAGFETKALDPIREHPNYLQFNALLYLAGVAYEQTIERWCKPIRPWILGVFWKPASCDK